MLRDWRNFYKSKREEGLFSVEAFVAGGVNSALEGETGGGQRRRIVEMGKRGGRFLCANFARSLADKRTKSKAFSGLIPQAGVCLMPVLAR